MTREEQIRAEIRAQYPPPLELARIAATLAAGREFSEIGARTIAEQAISLVEACYSELDEHVEGKLNERMLEENNTVCEAAAVKIPAPKKLPVSFDDFVRLVVRGKTETDRMVLYREYISYALRSQKRRAARMKAEAKLKEAEAKLEAILKSKKTAKPDKAKALAKKVAEARVVLQHFDGSNVTLSKTGKWELIPAKDKLEDYPETTLDERNTEIARQKAQGFDEQGYYDAALRFFQWLECRDENMREKKARDAANKRHSNQAGDSVEAANENSPAE